MDGTTPTGGDFHLAREVRGPFPRANWDPPPVGDGGGRNTNLLTNVDRGRSTNYRGDRPRSTSDRPIVDVDRGRSRSIDQRSTCRSTAIDICRRTCSRSTNLVDHLAPNGRQPGCCCCCDAALTVNTVAGATTLGFQIQYKDRDCDV